MKPKEKYRTKTVKVDHRTWIIVDARISDTEARTNYLLKIGENERKHNTYQRTKPRWDTLLENSLSE